MIKEKLLRGNSSSGGLLAPSSCPAPTQRLIADRPTRAIRRAVGSVAQTGKVRQTRSHAQPPTTREKPTAPRKIPNFSFIVGAPLCRLAFVFYQLLWMAGNWLCS